MHKKFINLLLVIISTYIGLVFVSVPLYNKYKKTYNDQKIKLRDKTINKTNKLKNRRKY